MTDYTDADTERLLEFAGVWKAGERCFNESGRFGHCSLHNDEIGHFVKAPSLTGDFADVVEAKIRRRLTRQGHKVTYTAAGVVITVFGDGMSKNHFYDDNDIFAATLAYLKEQEGE